MEEKQNFAHVLNRFIDRAEMILAALLLVGVIGNSMGIGLSDKLILIGLGGLAGVFFLSAFRPPVGAPQPTQEKSGALDLLAQTMLPKIMWISCAVCCASLMLFVLRSDNEGYKPGLMLHTAVTTVGLLIIGLGILTGSKNIRALFPILLRAVPLMLTAVYLVQGDLAKLVG